MYYLAKKRPGVLSVQSMPSLSGGALSQQGALSRLPEAKQLHMSIYGGTQQRREQQPRSCHTPRPGTAPPCQLSSPLATSPIRLTKWEVTQGSPSGCAKLPSGFLFLPTISIGLAVGVASPPRLSLLSYTAPAPSAAGVKASVCCSPYRAKTQRQRTTC